MVTPINSLGETAEIAELLRLFVNDKFSEVALTARTAGKPHKEQMAQFSKRGKVEEDEEEHLEEDMGESAQRSPLGTICLPSNNAGRLSAPSSDSAHHGFSDPSEACHISGGNT